MARPAGRDARAKLKEIGQTVDDIRGVATYAQAVGILASATKTLTEQQRKAFGLDDDEDKGLSAVDEILRKINSERHDVAECYQ